MHGIIRPVINDGDRVGPSRAAMLMAWARRRKALLGFVVLPTLVAAGYYYLAAADQYESEAHFTVRSAQSSQAPSSGLSSLISLGGGSSTTKTDAMSVIDYLESTEAVLELDKRINLVGRFHNDQADIVSRLRSADPTPEALTKYYRKHVKAEFNDEASLATLAVHTFRPVDSLLIANTLLRMGEERINILNQRSYGDALVSSTRQLDEAESALADIQVKLTRFRSIRSDIDPEGTGKVQTSLVAQLTAGAATARAQLQAMNGIISPSSPQYVAMRARVRALDSQIAGQAARLTGDGSIANKLGDYENLRVRQEFAVKRYEAAAAAYQAAREDARKKRLYLVRIVNPNMPVKSLYPERARIVFTIFFAMLVTYAIGWLVLAGVKEHVNG